MGCSVAGWAQSLWARGRAGWGAGALCRRHGWMPCGWQGIGVTAVVGVPQPGGTGSSHRAECTAGPSATMLLAPCVPPAPATCLPGVAVWGGVGINEGLSPWSLQLCPPQLLRCQPGCRLPPCLQSLLQPQQESLAPPRPIGACRRAPAASRRGRLCHMEPGAPGTTGACAGFGAGTRAPWPLGQPLASPAPGTRLAEGQKATGRARVPHASDQKQLGAGWSPQPGTTSPVTLCPPVPDFQVMEDGVAPPSIPACAAPGPAAGMGKVTRAGCAVLAHGRPSPPGAGVPGGAGCHAGARCQGREGWKGGACQGGGAGGTRMQLPPGPAGRGAAPGGVGTPGSPPAAWGTGQPCRVSRRRGAAGAGGLRSCTK